MSEYTGFAGPFGQRVGTEDQYDTDQRFKQSDCRRLAVGSLCDAQRVNICIKHLRYGPVQGVAHQEDLFKARIQYITHPQDQHDDDGAADSGQRDMPGLAEAPGPVHNGRFIELQVHARHGGEEYDGSPSSSLPYGLPDDHRAEHVGGGEKFHAFQSKGLQHAVDDPGGGEDRIGQTCDDDPGKKVGYIDTGLDRFFQPLHPQLIDQEREQDRGGKSQHDIQQRDPQRVDEQLGEVRAAEKLDKVLHTHPCAVKEAGVRVVILKSDQHAPHGSVFE